MAKWISSWGLRPEWLTIPSDTSDTLKDDAQIGSVITGLNPGSDPTIEARETVPEQVKQFLPKSGSIMVAVIEV